MTTTPNEQSELLPCPFCGATPHRGLMKLEYCQLHGDPFQRYRIWCPHECADISRVNDEQARTAWNTRLQPPPAVAQAGEVETPSVFEIVDRLRADALADIPDWVEDRWKPIYQQMQVDHTEDQIATCARIYKGDWTKLAATTLHIAGTMSPQQGSFHHNNLILARALEYYGDFLRAALQPPPAVAHIFHQCVQPCEKPGQCPYCDGGLAFCTVCRAGEGELETYCPGPPAVAQAGEVARVARAISDANWKDGCDPTFLDKQFNDESLHNLFLKQARAALAARHPTGGEAGEREGMSCCNKCGARYPSAPVGTIHKCGACSGGYCSREATPEQAPLVDEVPTASEPVVQCLLDCIRDFGSDEPFVVSKEPDGWAVRLLSAWQVLNPPASDAGTVERFPANIELVAKAMFEACQLRRYADFPDKALKWPPCRELQDEWLEHARAAIAALNARPADAEGEG